MAQPQAKGSSLGAAPDYPVMEPPLPAVVLSLELPLRTWLPLKTLSPPAMVTPCMAFICTRNMLETLTTVVVADVAIARRWFVQLS